jgi:hypothetical protein
MEVHQEGALPIGLPLSARQAYRLYRFLRHHESLVEDRRAVTGGGNFCRSDCRDLALCGVVEAQSMGDLLELQEQTEDQGVGS